MHVLLMRGKAKDDITYDLHDSIMGQHIFAIKKKETIHTHAHTQNIYIYIYISHSKPIQQTGQQVETKPHDIARLTTIN